MFHSPTMLQMPRERAPMTNGTEDQVSAIREWIEEIKTRFRVDIPAIARKSRVSASTIYRWFDDEHPFSPSLTSVRKIAQAFGMPMPDKQEASRGFVRGEAESLLPAELPDELPLMDGQSAWRIVGRSLELAGVLPGDMLLVDANETPRSGDVVCAQVFNMDRGVAEPKFRVFEPPFLVARTMDPSALDRPLFIDNERVFVAGVVVRSLRLRG